MFTQQIYKSRTAGCGHFFTLLISLSPFLCFICRSHIPSEPYLDHIRKSQFHQCTSDRSHGDIISILSFYGWCTHSDHFFSCQNIFNDRNKICFGTDRTKRTGMNTMSALDTFAVINSAQSIFIISNCIYRTHFFTGTFQMDNCTIWTCFCAHSAFLTLLCINMHPYNSF